jgi:hypothetical protein
MSQHHGTPNVVAAHRVPRLIQQNCEVHTMVYFYMLFAALAGSAVYIGHKLSPKMLVYRLRIRPFPSIVRSKRPGQLFQLAVSAHVELYNENLIHLDIHALSFDFYVRNQQDQLRHLGSVFDTFPSAANKNVTSMSPSILSTSSSTTALWSLSAQTHFTTRTKLAVALRPWRALQSTWGLMRQLLRDGHLQMTTTGVAHIGAAAAQNCTALPFTITITCDNRVDLRLNGLVDILGKDCAMKQMTHGWLDLSETAALLRNSTMAQKALMAA